MENIIYKEWFPIDALQDNFPQLVCAAISISLDLAAIVNQEKRKW